MQTDLNQSLAKIKAELAPHFKPALLQQQLLWGPVIYQFVFDAEPAFYLEVTNDDFTFHAGVTEAATLTLTIDSQATCLGLLQGELDGMQAFMEGRYRADGHIVLSQLLLYLFRADNLNIAYQVKD